VACAARRAQWGPRNTTHGATMSSARVSCGSSTGGVHCWSPCRERIALPSMRASRHQSVTKVPRHLPTSFALNGVASVVARAPSLTHLQSVVPRAMSRVGRYDVRVGVSPITGGDAHGRRRSPAPRAAAPLEFPGRADGRRSPDPRDIPDGFAPCTSIAHGDADTLGASTAAPHAPM